MSGNRFSTDDLRQRLGRQRILIVGDVMLDEYVWGAVRRISPEAPVPVVELTRRSHVPGGAANAAANVAGLGAQAELIGVIGADVAGTQLRAALDREGVAAERLIAVDGRPTTVKTRIIAHSQQMVRVDHECCDAVAAAIEGQIARHIAERVDAVDACILSDYGKGLVTPRVARCLMEAAATLGKPVIVDPKGADYAKYRGAAVVKPNLQEAAQFLGREIGSSDDLLDAGRRMLAFLGHAGVLITRGAAGMTLFEKAAEPLHIPAQAREVYDVTGAGDTVIGTLAVALAAGASLAEAARFASKAAGVIVGRVGTSAINADDL